MDFMFDSTCSVRVCDDFGKQRIVYNIFPCDSGLVPRFTSIKNLNKEYYKDKTIDDYKRLVFRNYGYLIGLSAK